MPLDIKAGQSWHTRSGAVVRVSADRGPFAIVDRWKWALSNGHIADRDGRVGADGPHDSDLMRLAEEPPLSQKQVDAMDSTFGGLGGRP